MHVYVQVAIGWFDTVRMTNNYKFYCAATIIVWNILMKMLANSNETLPKITPYILAIILVLINVPNHILLSPTNLMQEAEKKLEECTGELVWHRKQATSIEQKYLVLEKEISNHCKKNREDSAHQQLADKEMGSLRKRLEAEHKDHCDFLQVLLSLIPQEYYPTSTAIGAVNLSGWAKLSTSLMTSVQLVLKALAHLKREVNCSKMVLERQNTLLESASQLHEEALSKQALKEEEKEKQWEKRLVELKRNYEVLLMAKGVTTSSHSTRSEGGVAATLEMLSDKQGQASDVHSQLTQLKEAHKTHRSDRACLLSCVSLMIGSLHALHKQNRQLRYQKNVLIQLLKQSHPVYPITVSNRGRTFRFRVTVLVVIAMNRLKAMAAHFIASNSVHAVPYISSKDKAKKLTSNALTDVDIARWLRSEQVLLDVRRCYSCIQSTLDLCTSLKHKPHFASSVKGLLPEATNVAGHRDLKSMVMTCHLDFLNTGGHFL